MTRAVLLRRALATAVGLVVAPLIAAPPEGAGSRLGRAFQRSFRRELAGQHETSQRLLAGAAKAQREEQIALAKQSNWYLKSVATEKASISYRWQLDDPDQA